MTNYFTFVCCIFGVLLINGVFSYTKNPNQNTGKLEDGSQDDDSAQEKELSELKNTMSQLTQSIQEFKHTLEHKIDNIHLVIDSHQERNIHQDGFLDVSNLGESGSCSNANAEINYSKSPPKIRNPETFDFAICNVLANSKIESNLTGRIILFQKKNSPTLYITIQVRGFDVNTSTSEHTSNLEDHQQGSTKTGKSEKIVSNVLYHGFHVHERADLTDGCDSTGGHYNPYHSRHGSPESSTRHLGDFGNIESDKEGVTNLLITDEIAALRGQNNIAGKPLVIHKDVDDLGRYPNNRGSTTTGNAGVRLGCCIIQKIPSSLFNTYEFSKLIENE